MDLPDLAFRQCPCEAAGFYLNGKAHVCGGEKGRLRKDHWQFDPTTNAWSQKAEFAGSARHGATGFTIGTKGYIAAGYTGTASKDLWQYDAMTNAWSRKADLGGDARWGAGVFVVNDKAYLCAGKGSTDLRDLWCYDPATNTWSRSTDLPGAVRESGTSVSTGSACYMGTGIADRKPTNDRWLFTPAPDIAVPKPPVPPDLTR